MLVPLVPSQGPFLQLACSLNHILDCTKNVVGSSHELLFCICSAVQILTHFLYHSSSFEHSFFFLVHRVIYNFNVAFFLFVQSHLAGLKPTPSSNTSVPLQVPE